MFEIPVWDLLTSFTWDSKELEFEGEILPGFYDDIEFKTPLYLKIKLISLDDWIMVVFEKIKANVMFEWTLYFIDQENIEREFRKTYDAKNPDDIKYIDMKNISVDLKDVIREEILITCID